MTGVQTCALPILTDERFNHYACGWIERICVRMLDDNRKITNAGKAILHWKEKLEDYPIADDEDYYERIQQAELELVEMCLPSGMKSDLPDDFILNILNRLYDEGAIDGENYLDQDKLEEICRELNYMEKEDE